MSYTALYRKWRPQFFKDVRGQDSIVRTLKNQIVTGRIGHAYLFCGTRGTGKTTMAKIFARAVNCEHPADGEPCGECESCRQAADGSSLNVVEIDGATYTSINDIRDIIDQIKYPPAQGRYMVYIIDEVHMLSTFAFNALLKTLEEPPGYVIFILATTDPYKIPATVLSRCQRYDFRRIAQATIVDRLKELAAAEGISAEEKALRYIAKTGDGSMRDSLSILDQCASFYYGEELTYDKVIDVLGTVDNAVFRKLFRAIIGCDIKNSILILDEMVAQGRELSQVVTDFIWYLRNILLIKTAEGAEELVDMSSENIALLRDDAALADVNAIARYIRIFSELLNQIRYTSQKRVLVEIALIRLEKPEMDRDYDAVLQRIERLEGRIAEGATAWADNIGAYSADNNICAVGEGDVRRGEARPNMEVATGNSRGNVPGQNIGGDGNKAQSRSAGQTGGIPGQQAEELAFIRGKWGEIAGNLGSPEANVIRNAEIVPGDRNCLNIIVENNKMLLVCDRNKVVGKLEGYVRENYGRDIKFRFYSREQDTGRYGTPGAKNRVTDEQLRKNIKMEIGSEE